MMPGKENRLILYNQYEILKKLAFSPRIAKKHERYQQIILQERTDEYNLLFRDLEQGRS